MALSATVVKLIKADTYLKLKKKKNLPKPCIFFSFQNLSPIHKYGNLREVPLNNHSFPELQSVLHDFGAECFIQQMS